MFSIHLVVEPHHELISGHASLADVDVVILAQKSLRLIRQGNPRQDRARQWINSRCGDLVARKWLIRRRVDDRGKGVSGNWIEAAEVAATQRLTGQERGVGYALPDAEPLVVGEKERAVVTERPTEARTELVLAEGRNRAMRIIKEILSIQRAVAQEFVSCPGEPVRSGT